MSRNEKPFEQYRTLLPDGRSVVAAVEAGPVRIAAWVVADSKRDALARLREFGARDPHVDKLFRPGHRLAALAASDPGGIVFVDDPHESLPETVRPSSELRAHLARVDVDQGLDRAADRD